MYLKKNKSKKSEKELKPVSPSLTPSLSPHIEKGPNGPNCILFYALG
jgi:hypothetical protein